MMHTTIPATEPTRRRPRRRARLVGGALAMGLMVAACGSDGDTSAESTVSSAEDAATSTASTAPSTATTAGPANADAVVSIADSSFGEILVDADGVTLYGFTNDTDGTPTCVEACADAWPPLIVDGEELPAGLDATVYSVVERPDGTFQLSAGVWPLYHFAGDAAPGDTNGQASGDVWFVVKPDGTLNKGDDAATATSAPAGPETTANDGDY